jgi:hypothetical protein
MLLPHDQIAHYNCCVHASCSWWVTVGRGQLLCTSLFNFGMLAGGGSVMRLLLLLLFSDQRSIVAGFAGRECGHQGPLLITGWHVAALGGLLAFVP